VSLLAGPCARRAGWREESGLRRQGAARSRNADHDSRASILRTDDLERTPDFQRALAHRTQARARGEALLGIEPDAVVSDLQEL